MRDQSNQAAPASVPDNIPARAEFFTASPFPANSGFLDERSVLTRIPVSRRTWGNWKARGLIPYIKIGRRCLYDWENVANALRRMQRGGGQ